MKFVFFIPLIFVIMPIYGQQMSDEYERMFGEGEAFHETEPLREFETDTIRLFSSGKRSISVFNHIARRNFNFVYYDNRGYDSGVERFYLGNLDISSGIDKYPNYLLFNILHTAIPRFEEYSDAGNAILGGAMGAVVYEIRPSLARRGISLRTDYSERLFRGGGRISAAGELGSGWHGMVNVRYRAGMDRFIGGVFSESGVAAAAVEKDFGRGNLALIALGGLSQSGLRLWTVEEAYDLTGNNLYNPSWGWFGGRQRNSQVRNDGDLLLAATYSTARVSGSRVSKSRSALSDNSSMGYEIAAGSGAASDSFSGTGSGSRRTTDITMSLMYLRGERNRSGLAWQDGALNPMPDNYMKLPGYFPDPYTSGMLADLWATDPDVRLLDWAGLADANRYGDGAVYIMGNSVKKTDSFQAVFSASSRLSKAFTLGYGARLSAENNSFFRVAEDMLGGQYFWYGGLSDTENGGMDNPGPQNSVKVYEGERFGYDFDILRLAGEFYVTGNMAAGRWTLGFDATLRGVSVHREDHMPQEFSGNDTRRTSGSFPEIPMAFSSRHSGAAPQGGTSSGHPGNAGAGKLYPWSLYGALPEGPGSASQVRSDKFRTLLYDARLCGRYSFSPRSSMSATLWAGTREPAYQDIFFDATSGNMLVPNLAATDNSNAETAAAQWKNLLAAGAELSFEGYLSQAIRAEIAAYYTHTSRGIAAYRYWDDIRSESVVLQLYGIERSYAGVQAAVNAALTGRFSLTGAMALGRHIYASNAFASVRRRSDMELLSEGESVHIEGLVCTPSPQALFAVSARYAVAYSWSFEASCVYASGRHVSINPARRSDSVLDAASSPETRAAFMHQESLPPAFALNLGVSGHFRLFGRDVYAGISINNLLGRKDMVYGGYEQMRVRSSGQGPNRTFSPFPSRFAYCYPRTIYASLTVNL